MSDRTVTDQRRVERTQEKGEGRDRRAELLLDKQAKERARQDQLEGRQAQIEMRLLEIERRLAAIEHIERRLGSLEQATERIAAQPLAAAGTPVNPT